MQPIQPRKAAYSVAETARLCGISRARFYDLIHGGVMPHPVYCIRTRRPMFTADLAALCVRVRQTNTAIDGRYVIFYSRRAEPSVTSSSPKVSSSRPEPTSPLAREMIETLRAMGVQGSESETLAAIKAQCPTGPTEHTFEIDLRAVFDQMRCRNAG